MTTDAFETPPVPVCLRASGATDQLAGAKATAQGEMHNAPLNKVNPHFKSKYADLAAIRDATVPALAKNGLAISQVTGFDPVGGFCLFTRLTHSSGQWEESLFPLPTAYDKPQVMGSAITYARRYSWAAVCGIAADEDDDANAASGDKGNGKAPEARQATATRGPATTGRPAPAPAPAAPASDASPMPADPVLIPVPSPATGETMAAVWNKWVQTFCRCLAASQSVGELDAWVHANDAPLAQLKIFNTKTAAYVDDRIAERVHKVGAEAA